MGMRVNYSKRPRVGLTRPTSGRKIVMAGNRREDVVNFAPGPAAIATEVRSYLMNFPEDNFLCLGS